MASTSKMLSLRNFAITSYPIRPLTLPLFPTTISNQVQSPLEGKWREITANVSPGHHERYKSKQSIFQLNSFHFYQLSCQGTKNMKNTERMDCSGLNMTVTNTFQLLFILHLVRQRVWNIDSHQKNILKQLNWRIMRQLNKKMPEALAIKKTWTCGCFDSESDHANVFMFSE